MERKDHMTYATLAGQVRQAIKGVGTDDAALISILASFDYYDLRMIGDAYGKCFGKDMIQDVKDDTSFNYKKLAEALLMKRADVDARAVRNAVKNLGTDDDTLIEIICTRKPAELKQVIDAYTKEYKRNMIEDVRDDVSGHYGKLMIQVLTSDRSRLPDAAQMERDFNDLYEAGEGRAIGTDQETFIRILGGNHRVYVEQLGILYMKRYGHTLAKAIKSETSFNFQQALLALVTPVEEYLADMLRKAVSGAGTNEDALIRIVTTQKDRNLRGIARAFQLKYNATLVKWVEDDTSGDFKKLLVSVLRVYASPN